MMRAYEALFVFITWRCRSSCVHHQTVTFDLFQPILSTVRMTAWLLIFINIKLIHDVWLDYRLRLSLGESASEMKHFSAEPDLQKVFFMLSETNGRKLSHCDWHTSIIYIFILTCPQTIKHAHTQNIWETGCQINLSFRLDSWAEVTT